MEKQDFTYRRKHWGSGLVLAIVIGFGAFVATNLIALSSPKSARQASRALPAAREYEGFDLMLRVHFRPLPAKMPGSAHDTPKMVALGRKLYFERGISLTKSQACNDCHRLDRGFAGVDNKPTSKGAKGISGKRNSPTVLNAGFHATQFWDGRAADLVEQAKGPLLNPIEMSMRSERDVVNRLNSSTSYRRAFALAFPRHAAPVTFDNVARAIAAFERTLITPSRFDRYLRGDKTALTAAEVRGLHRFVHTGCIECHSSHPIGARTLQTLGVYHPYANRRDLGRWEVTHRAEDKFMFKPPSLRNVTLTHPYFHDGKVAKLTEAVRQMAWMQIDKKLTPREVNEIVSFLGSLKAERPIVIAGP